MLRKVEGLVGALDERLGQQLERIETQINGRGVATLGDDDLRSTLTALVTRLDRSGYERSGDVSQRAPTHPRDHHPHAAPAKSPTGVRSYFWRSGGTAPGSAAAARAMLMPTCAVGSCGSAPAQGEPPLHPPNGPNGGIRGESAYSA